jgi:pyruvate dehydrogenase E2 component (dihydrolipoamide acetyltransferase)
MAEAKDVPLPDIGDFDAVEVIEVLISAGDTIAAEDSMITLESDKASMEIPAPFGGKVAEVKVKVGDYVAEGNVICTVEPAEEEPASQPSEGASGAERTEAGKTEAKAEATPTAASEPAGAQPSGTSTSQPATTAPAQPAAGGRRSSPTENIPAEHQRKAHASPGVRRFARELGVDLLQVTGSGRKHRILKDDVKGFVKHAMSQPASAGGGLGIAPAPEIDFSQFGETETQALTRINKLTGENLHRNWVTIPHVTQFDKADITDLEAFRKQLNEEHKQKGEAIKTTLVSFLLKAIVSALKRYPRFNSSLDATGENLIFKKYFHIGVAVDTKDGLVVPVLRDVERKSLTDLAGELMDLSAAARDKKLSRAQMQGGCFTISSLGGVGGTAFTPIVNAPEVAILGASRASMEPVWNGQDFAARLMLPLSLSYDHRVIDGADAARFTSYLSELLSDTRRMLL